MDPKPAESASRKSFPVFDCDAHVNDPIEIWDTYVGAEHRELVKQGYWRDERQAILNGRTRVTGGADAEFEGGWNPLAVGGPGVNIELLGRLLGTPLTPDQRRSLHHQGAYDPEARVRDMDLMGVDQALVLPGMLLRHLPLVESQEAARVLAQAYNNWVAQWCAAHPDRLFPAALLPVQNTVFAVQELRRVATMGFRVAAVQSMDAVGGSPGPVEGRRQDARWAPLYRAIEETGVALGVHPGLEPPGLPPEGTTYSAGEEVIGGGFGAGFEGMTWTAHLLLSGLLDRYPGLKVLVFEAGCGWLPEMLEHCDLLFKLYANERPGTPGSSPRLPSEAFNAQCVIGFGSDDIDAFQQWERVQGTGAWSSNAYQAHSSGAQAALRNMAAEGVPESAQANLLGANIRRLLGIGR